MTKQTFAIMTLGCKVNQEEGVALANLFQEHGWQQVSFQEPAGVYIVNTCTVTHLADKKSRQTLRRASRQNPGALIVATGCYAQTGKGDLLAIPGIHLIVGTNDRPRLYDLVTAMLQKGNLPATPVAVVNAVEEAKEFQEIGNLNNDTRRKRAFLKIEDGCSQFCSYCIIPYARGPVRSKPPDRVLAEAAELIEKGYLELVLTGIHTGAYGTDFADGTDLAALAARLVRLPGLHRLRLGSIEPQEVSEALIELAAANQRVCPHFHIPLQACCNQTLQAMNRQYTVEFYADLLRRIRRAVPNAAITTDVIVGFPGETEADFQQGLETIKDLRFADMHIFPYSPRQGTPAADYPGQVPAPEKEARAARLRSVAAASRLAYWQQQIGRVAEVILEQQETKQDVTMMTGHSANYLPLALPAFDGLKPGQLWQVEIKEIGEGHLLCHEISCLSR